MKTSARQKAASETIALSITMLTDMTSSSKKNIDKDVRWITEAKANLNKIAEATGQLRK